MIEDFAEKRKYRTAIRQQLKEELNLPDVKLEAVEKILTTATLDELERTYQAFGKFGVKAIFNAVN